MRKDTTVVRLFGLSIIVAGQFSLVQAAIEMPGIFSDHAVLQSEQPVPVWGNAAPNEGITVKFADQKKTAIADANGKWRVELDSMPATDQANTLTISADGEEIKFSDIVVGEVWLCSGQSNMYMPLGKGPFSEGVIGGEAEIARPEQPELRLYCWEGQHKEWKAAGLSGWQRANPTSRPPFSATAYFFGNALQTALKVPVGVINISAGGSPISPWTPQENALKVPLVAHYHDLYLQNKPEIDARNAQWGSYLEVMKKRSSDATLAAYPAPVQPEPLTYNLFMAQRFAGFGLYESFIAPIVPYALRGVTWYQGEANADNLELSLHYEEMLRMLITSWREKWGQPRLPFYFVQLPCWENNDNARFWHVNRQSMLNVLRSMPDVGMAVTADVGDIHDLHPTNKRPVGERLALWALAKTYGKPVIYSGPLVSRITTEGEKLRIQFDTCGSVLKLHGPAWADLEVAGADGLYFPASATLSDTEAVVASPSVSKPVAARYGWKFVFTPTLFNREGLPASPFALSVSAK